MVFQILPRPLQGLFRGRPTGARLNEWPASRPTRRRHAATQCRLKALRYFRRTRSTTQHPGHVLPLGSGREPVRRAQPASSAHRTARAGRKVPARVDASSRAATSLDRQPGRTPPAGTDLEQIPEQTALPLLLGLRAALSVLLATNSLRSERRPARHSAGSGTPLRPRRPGHEFGYAADEVSHARSIVSGTRPVPQPLPRWFRPPGGTSPRRSRPDPAEACDGEEHDLPQAGVVVVDGANVVQESPRL
jgi:hypothetical protein